VRGEAAGRGRKLSEGYQSLANRAQSSTPPCKVPATNKSLFLTNRILKISRQKRLNFTSQQKDGKKGGEKMS